MIPSRKLSRGAIAWMTNNSVAANLLMMVMLIGGLILGLQLRQEVFPEFELGVIEITITIPGATPEEVEKGAVLSIEQSVQSVDGIKEVTSTSTEGVGSVMIELEDGVDNNVVLQDVKAEVDRITTFPVEAEPVQVSLRSTKRQILRLMLNGNVDPLALREWAEQTRDELLLSPDITQVELDNVLDHEIIIEISQENLRRYNLTITDVSNAIKQNAIELGGGSINALSGDILVRLNERKDYANEFNTIAIRTDEKGGRLLLEDIATVTDGFEDTSRHVSFNGKPAIAIEVYSIGDQTPSSVANATKKVVERLNQIMPEGLHIDITYNSADVFEDRADLLIGNAGLGIVLVFIALSLFLQPSLAFWVSLGIPVSIMGSFLFLPFFDITINMMSMFAFLLTLGIVVDDAIVVGENIGAERERGKGRLEAAVVGTREVGIPVVFSVLTNIVAFLPLLFIPGTMGKIWASIPVVVVAVFFCSLIESLFILPAHLAHQSTKPSKTSWLSGINRLQAKFSSSFLVFVENRYGAILDFAIKRRYTVLSIGIGFLVISVAYVYSGRLGFDLMPRAESDYAYVEAVLPTGTAESRVLRVRDRLLASAEKVVAENGGDELSIGIYSSVRGSSVYTLVYLTPTDVRPLDTGTVTNLWRKETGEIQGLESISFESDRGGPGSGKGLTIVLSHRDAATLDLAAVTLGEMLENYGNLSDIDTGVGNTKRQFEMTLKPLAEQLGLTSDDIARQVRAVFEGSIALRQQRGRDEVTVRVRMPEEDRESLAVFENLILRTSTGMEILLRDVVEIDDGRAYSSIKHTDGKRTVNVAAAVNPSSATGLMMETVTNEVLPELMSNYPGLSWDFGGRQSDIRESLDSLYVGLVMALLAIYALLAIPFKSYKQPLIIMVAIPFGAVGAIGGHILMGYSLSVISLIGMLALSGVVVNDSLVLIDFANNRRKDGFELTKAVRLAGIARFRAITLTTITTFIGLAPMIFETSRQAVMLIPVAISLGFGILFASFICLVLVPALYLILEDLFPAKTIEHE